MGSQLNTRSDWRPRTRSTFEQTDPSHSESANSTKKLEVCNNSRPSSSSVFELSPPHPAPEVLAGTAAPRISKARKSLDLYFENASKIDASKSRDSRLRNSPSYLESESIPPDRICVPPPHSYFWKYPSPSSASVDEESLRPTRRSQRLIKKETSPAPGAVEATSSQDLRAVDQISIHSDYGTASENSFTMRAAGRRGKRKSDNIQQYIFGTKKVRQSDTERISESQGYESDLDLDDNLSDLLLHEFESGTHQSWESDDNQHQVVIEKARKVEAWDCEVAVEETDENSPAYLNISNLNARHERCVEYIVHRGIRCVIPLTGYKLPEGTARPLIDPRSSLEKRKCRLAPADPTNQTLLFSIQIFNNIDVESALLKKGLRVISASPVVSIQPHGTKFCEIYPAIVSIPLDVYPSAGDEIYCLFSHTSNALLGEDFKWCVQPDIRIIYDECDNNHTTVSFETYQFCFFTIIIREKRLMATKQIRSRIGGKLVVPDSKGIEVNFPKGSVPENIIARAKVHFDSELSVPDFLEENDHFEGVCLASPILMLEPHGRIFSPEGVTIQLPIPDYDIIMDLYGSQARLTIWESLTGENEVSDWKLLNVKYSVSRVKQTTVISFKVYHFSFFRAVWDLISASLYDAKVGVSYFYPYMSFAMKCQAYMEENSERNSFGLEVICYRSDKLLPLPELTNYVHRVGASSKPKLVRPGKIIVRLKSLFFEADIDAGEDPSLEKEEADFRGRDFEMQYACKFKPDNSVERGTFGKVVVKRFIKAGTEEALFEFNLQKSGHEGESTPLDMNDRWSIVALKELATNLFITDGDNWKLFASRIGFTKREIKTNLKHAPDPFVSMIQMYQHRGGTPDEFVQFLYSVHREIKVNAEKSPSSRASSNSSSGRGSLPGKFYGQNSDSDTTGTQISQDSFLNGTRKRSNPNINRSGGSGSKGKLKRKKTKLSGTLPARNSDKESSSSGHISSSSESDEATPPESAFSGSSASRNQRNDLMKLEHSFIWDLSASMDSLNWRALGRSLGVEEHVLLNIEHSYKTSGFRECAYQMLIGWKEKFPTKCTYGTLYAALRKENMNAVAKKMRSVSRNV